MDEILKLGFLNETNYTRILIDVLLLFLSSKAIEYVYQKYVYSNDNKLMFTRHVFPYLISIFLIVSVIKTSIALSLGLVGALSIIRFRTAIKEPGQLITLLILTALSISMAAEKELLGILMVFIYIVHTSLTNIQNNKIKNDFENPKILRISLKQNNLDLSKLIELNSIERIYSDVNKVIHLEFLISSKKSEMDLILKKVKSHGEIITYEFL
jgi:hypothetical protein